MAVRSYLEVPTQDLARSPLSEGQTLPGLCVFGILAVFKSKSEGKDAWNNFDKTAKAKGSDGESLLSNEGVQVTHAKVVGKPKARRTVEPKDVPSFLAVVYGKPALPTLEGLDLLETLVARGVDRERAKDLMAEQVQKLQEKPEDVETLAQVSQVFGTPRGAVRTMRTPKRNGEGSVFVMSAIDLVMAARGCDYAAAQSIVFRIFKDYYKVDLEEENRVENQVEYQTDCLILYTVRFPGQGQSTHARGVFSQITPLGYNKLKALGLVSPRYHPLARFSNFPRLGHLDEICCSSSRNPHIQVLHCEIWAVRLQAHNPLQSEALAGRVCEGIG